MNAWEGVASIVGSLILAEAFFGVVSGVVAAFKPWTCQCELEEDEDPEDEDPKSTQRITRKQALETLLREIPELPNDALGDVMDALAETGLSKTASKFDNFIVSEFGE